MMEGAGAHPSIPGTNSTLGLVTPPQADAIYNMIGYPKFIMDPKELDKVFNDVSWSDVPWVSYSPLHYHTQDTCPPPWPQGSLEL